MADQQKPVDYQLVLVDLRARRAALDASIAGIEEMLGLRVAEVGQDGSTAAGNVLANGSAEIPKAAFFGMSIAEAAEKYLQMVKEPQTNNAICEALKRGGIKSLSKAFPTTVYSILNRNADKFARVDKGHWGLVEWYGGRSRLLAARTSEAQANRKQAKAVDSGGSAQTKGGGNTAKSTKPGTPVSNEKPGATTLPIEGKQGAPTTIVQATEAALAMIRTARRPVPLDDIVTSLNSRGIAVSKLPLSGALGKLIKRGVIARVGTNAYQLPISSGGSSSEVIH